METVEKSESPILVQKYGGTSVASVAKIRHVASRVVAARKRGYQVVVVVSAMGDTTNQLLLMAGEMTEQPPRRELDMLLTVGERISMSLLSMAIQEQGYEAISMTGSQCGILTNDRHFEAKIIEVRPIRVQDELEKGKVVIVAGYQGMSYKREITTLGRGGSDTTAVALAAALGAEACEIYTDVDGVYEGDPRVVLDAQKIDTLTYGEMEEMARHGARVLHAESVEFARKHQIALYVRGTRSDGVGTLVRQDRDLSQEGGEPFVVACLGPLCRVQMTLEPTQVARWFATLHASKHAPVIVDWNGQQGAWYFVREDCPDLEACLASWTTEWGSAMDVEEGHTVSLIGSCIGRESGVFEEAWLALSEALEVGPQRGWLAPLRVTFWVSPEERKAAQVCLYEWGKTLTGSAEGTVVSDS